MWIIQNNTLLSIPDDAPIPPYSVRVTLPDDFLRNPSHYRVEAARIVRHEPSPDIQPSPNRLTRDDIIKLKKAIERGDIS
jgi:hypothetical protein